MNLECMKKNKAGENLGILLLGVSPFIFFAIIILAVLLICSVGGCS